MTPSETDPVLEHETVQDVVEELLANARYADEVKARYRQRVGHALLMEVVETLQLVEEGRDLGEGA